MQNDDYNYDYTQPFIPKTPNKRPNNTVLIVAVSVLSSILVIGIVFAILFATGVISGKSDSGNLTQSVQDTAEPVQNRPQPEAQPTSSKGSEPVKPVPVGRTMFIGNCKQSVTLRNSPSISASEIRQVELAEEVYVIEYTNSEFAHVTYYGTDGYIGRKYIVETRPQIWRYSDSDAINQVTNSLRAFVNGINTGDTSYVSTYFAGSEANQEYESNKSIRKTVESEELMSVNCHSVQRISASEITVIRDSVIRVVYKDGTVKDLSERYKYTLDLSNGMRIIALSKA